MLLPYADEGDGLEQARERALRDLLDRRRTDVRVLIPDDIRIPATAPRAHRTSARAIAVREGVSGLRRVQTKYFWDTTGWKKALAK